jgi:hypothetical protein
MPGRAQAARWRAQSVRRPGQAPAAAGAAGPCSARRRRPRCAAHTRGACLPGGSQSAGTGQGTGVVGEDGEFQPQDLRPVVGVVAQGLHQARPTPWPCAAGSTLMPSIAAWRRRNWAGGCKPGAADDRTVPLGHHQQVDAARCRHLFDASAPQLFARHGQLQQVAVDLGMAHHAGNVGRVGRRARRTKVAGAGMPACPRAGALAKTGQQDLPTGPIWHDTVTRHRQHARQRARLVHQPASGTGRRRRQAGLFPDCAAVDGGASGGRLRCIVCLTTRRYSGTGSTEG